MGDAVWQECRACPDPCDNVGLFTEAYGEPFEVDCGEMKGPKQVDRQVFIATGKSDWRHDVTEEGAAHLLSQHGSITKTRDGTGSSLLSFYNCSMGALGSALQETVLLLPDYIFASAQINKLAEITIQSHQTLINSSIAQRVPYTAVILICSHTTRDARCGKAAPILASAFEKACHANDLHLDTTGSAMHHPEDVEDCIGLFYVSHIGGHKFAANVIIQLPNRPQIWLGRVLPQHAESIVRDTILDGKVPQNLLRGKIDISW